jgi:hypothetical protein
MGLKFEIILPLTPEYWDYRHAPPQQALLSLFSVMSMCQDCTKGRYISVIQAKTENKFEMK